VYRLATGVVSRYTYDHRNRLVRFEQHSAGGILLAEAEYVYDVFDRRIVKSVDPDGAGPQPRQETRFAYDGLNVWADFDAMNRVIARYLHGEGLDNLLARWRASDGTAWYLTDHLGTVRDIVDAAGAIINHLDYDSFGRLLSQTNALAGDRFGFTGREYDPELDLYFYRARYYDPQQGRFVSQDPLGFAAGDSNLYRYVANAPLTARDPMGTSWFYAILARRASAVAGGLVGGVLGFACGWAEGITTATVAHNTTGEPIDYGLAWRLAFTYAGIGAGLGLLIGSLSTAVQMYAGGVFLLLSAALTIADAPNVPWNVTVIRVGCVVLSAGVGPRFHRWLTPPIGRLPGMGGGVPKPPLSPKPLRPAGRPSTAPEPAPAPKPPTPQAISEPAPTRPTKPLRQLEFSFMEEPGSGGVRRLTHQPTSRTLAGVRNMHQPEKWQAGEEYVRELYCSANERHYPVDGTGGRFVDAPVDLPNGGVLAAEVKTYGQWRTVRGIIQQQEVPLRDAIRQQVFRDVWLRENVPGFDPRWLFLDASPSRGLLDFLAQHRIVSVSYR